MSDAPVNAIVGHESKRILSSFGMSVPKGMVSSGPDDLPDFKGPYAVKVSDPSILHKTEMGGVILGIQRQDDLRLAIGKMQSRFPGSPIIVEQMIESGVEVIGGITSDRQFGQVIMIGTGGIYAELFNDRSFRLVPLSKKDALSMIEETKLSRFISGFRGITISADAFVDFILKVSNFALRNRELLMGMDMNPIIARGSSFTVVDVKIILKEGVNGNDLLKER